jgi:hypothetical protein
VPIDTNLSTSVFTWLAAFEGDDLLHQAVKEGLDRNMEYVILELLYPF